MKRGDFLKLLTLVPLGGLAMQLSELDKWTKEFPITPKMPVAFFGHGSPMNAIERNDFSNTWRAIARNIPKPNAILCISAHWETRGTHVTAMPNPRTIHDFGGFPQALFDVQYPAPGSPDLAALVKQELSAHAVGEDVKWGLDHGTWSVLMHLYPEADIPVVQLSLDFTKGEQFHFDLGKQLAALRKRGVLVIGSGNMVHNLGMINWNMQNTGFDWALEANSWFKNQILNEDYTKIIQYKNADKAVQLSVPTAEHLRPLLYTLGLREKGEELRFFNDQTLMGSISMTGVLIG